MFQFKNKTKQKFVFVTALKIKQMNNILKRIHTDKNKQTSYYRVIITLALPGQMVGAAQMVPPPGVTAPLLLHLFHHKERRKVHLTLSWRKDCWDTSLI